MSFIAKYQYTRPSTGVAWHLETTSKDIKNYLVDNYMKPGLLIGLKKEGVSGLTLTVTNEWKDRDAMEKWFLDPRLQAYHQDKNDYNTANGVVMVSEEYTST